MLKKNLGRLFSGSGFEAGPLEDEQEFGGHRRKRRKGTPGRKISVGKDLESHRGSSHGGSPRIVIAHVSSLLQVVGTGWGDLYFWCQPWRRPGRRHGVPPWRSQSCCPIYAVSLGKGALPYRHPSARCVVERPQVVPSTACPQARCLVADGLCPFSQGHLRPVGERRGVRGTLHRHVAGTHSSDLGVYQSRRLAR